MSGLLEKLHQRTAPTRQASRGQPYNYPYLWFAKPSKDGEGNPTGHVDVVKLPGDPQNRAYYEDKGFTVLRPEEAREWEEAERPGVLEAQRQKAALISTIRRIGSRHPGVEIVDNLDDLTADELREFLEELGKVTGAPVKVMSKRFGVETPRREPEEDGVVVHSGAELQESIARSQRRRA